MPISAKLWQWILQHHSSGDRTFIWWWKAFNPNDEGVLVYTGVNTATPDIISESYSYWLGGVNPWTEVLLGLVVLTWPLASWTLTTYWNWPEWIFWSSWIATPTLWSGFYIWVWNWTGLRHWEIISNGNYTFVASHSSGVSVTRNFTISGIATNQMNRFPSGYFWVEWDTIAYVDGCTQDGSAGYGYKHRIPNDGWSGWSGLTPGHIWIDSSDHWRLHFVDSSGVYRRTILGDYQWVTYDSGSLPQTPWSWSTWYIYVQDIYWFHWTYLMFVWYDWKLYRLSHTTNLQ
jgi:hypothetical protein